MEIIMEIFHSSLVLHVILHEVGDVLKLQATVLLYVSYRLLNASPPFRDFPNANVVGVRDLSVRPHPLQSNNLFVSTLLTVFFSTFQLVDHPQPDRGWPGGSRPTNRETSLSVRLSSPLLLYISTKSDYPVQFIRELGSL